MSPIYLKSLVPIWKLIATQTQQNNLSIRTLLLLLQRTEHWSSSTKGFDKNVKIAFYSSCLEKGKTLEQSDDLWLVHVYTIELPQLGKDLLRGLTTGIFVNTSNFTSKKGKKGGLPLIFNESFRKIFDHDGFLHPFPQKDVIRDLRQVTMMYYKLEVASTPEGELLAHQKFIETDLKVKTNDWPDLSGVRKHFTSCLPNDPWDIRPHHSSGATSYIGKDNIDKRKFNQWLPKLMEAFPPEKYFITLWKKLRCGFIPLNVDPPSRLTTVPKDSRGPRTICIEPYERMFIQKGLMQSIYDYIETSSLAKGYINFTDQSVNVALAAEASVSGLYATIDLKDASDMVSWELVKKLVPYDWFVALDATRSTHTHTLHGTIQLKKFAPMGSALCFPIEAILFWSIARTVCNEVYVYGDDIIVPTRFAGEVMSRLEDFGLVINHDKSLITGSFKESCGGDFFDGYPIDTIQFKAYDLLSLVEFANSISDRYGNDLGEKLISHYEERESVFITRLLPDTPPQPGVFRTPYVASTSAFVKRKYNSSLQCTMYRILMPGTEDLDPTRERLSGEEYLEEWLTQKTVYSQPFSEIPQERSTRDVLNRRDPGFPNDKGKIKIAKRREKLSHSWVDITRFLEPKDIRA